VNNKTGRQQDELQLLFVMENCSDKIFSQS